MLKAEGLRVLADNCTQLTTLDLSYCGELSSAALEHVSKLHLLTRLVLCKCQNVTDPGLAHL